MESHLRSIIKAVTWRAGGTAVTFTVAWILTDRLELAAKIGLLDTTIKVAAFYIHERMWMKISFGKLKPPGYQI